MAEDEEVSWTLWSPRCDEVKNLTVSQLSQLLKKKVLVSLEDCRTLEESKVDGKVFLTMSRSDLKDLFPTEFLTRKKLWDFISSLSSANCKPRCSSTPTSTDSTMSTLSPYSSFEEDTVSKSQVAECQPPPLKRTKAREYSLSTEPSKERGQLLGRDFKLPISDAVKKFVAEKTFLDDATRRQLIRDCMTCLKAYSGERLSSEHFTEAAKALCQEVPVLKDERPPLWPEDVEFEYWSSTKRLLKKRHSNEKCAKKSGPASEVSVDLMNMGSKDDVDKHEKELRKELDKKHVNWKAVEQLQALTFTTRREEIGSITGRNAVSQMLEQFPYLEHEKVLLRELELHISKLTGKKCSQETFIERWSTLSECFLNDQQESGRSFAALSAIRSMHEPFEAKPPLLSLNEGEKMEGFLRTRVPSALPHLLFSMDEPLVYDRVDNAQIFVILEKDVLCECQPQAHHSIFISSLVTLLAVYFAFNLHYGETEKNMYKFLEEHVLGIVPKRKTYVLKQTENKLFSQHRTKTTASS